MLELTFLHFFFLKKTLWLGYNHLTLSFRWPRQVYLDYQTPVHLPT